MQNKRRFGRYDDIDPVCFFLQQIEMMGELTTKPYH